MKPRTILVSGGALTFLGLVTTATVGGAAGSWILLIGWISLIFGLHRFGREAAG